MKEMVIIDTDPGIDDAMATLMACKNPNIAVLAMTTVCGNSTIENTTRNARYILNYIGRNDIPVYSGSAKPLNNRLHTAKVHGASGLAGIDPKNKAGLTYDAVEQIALLLRRYPGKITILALGPLTNIARLAIDYPGALQLAKEIIVMGGAVEVPGNMSPYAEFNMYVDPEAADIVIRFPLKKTLIPLDVYNEAQMQIKDLSKITNSRIRELLLKMFAPYVKNIFIDTGIQAAILYDPLVVFYLTNLQAFTSIITGLEIELLRRDRRGQTVLFDCSSNNPSIIRVACTVDSNNFCSEFIRIMNL